jgi:hypothetical protein
MYRGKSENESENQSQRQRLHIAAQRSAAQRSTIVDLPPTGTGIAFVDWNAPK